MMNKPSTTRSYYLDWMRVSATIAVFFYHCARFFDKRWWHVKNPEADTILIAIVMFIGTWLMPAFFMISGISSSHMLVGQNARNYTAARIKRLFIPFLFGIFCIVPPQVYLERLTHNQFSGSFFEFIPHLFEGFYLFGGNFPWMGLHLWYLLILLIFSLLTLPLFYWLKSPSGSRLLRQIVDFIPHSLLLSILVLPVIILNITLNPKTAGCREAGGWNLFVYLLIFIYGFAFVANDSILRSLIRWRGAMLALSIITSVLFLGHFFYAGEQSFPAMGYAVRMIVRTLCCCTWLMTFTGFFALYRTENGRFLTYASEAVLPFYILHQTVIIIIGYYIVQLPLVPLLKYLIIVPSSFITVMAIYHFIIRPVAILRFLFGMK